MVLPKRLLPIAHFLSSSSVIKVLYSFPFKLPLVIFAFQEPFGDHTHWKGALSEGALSVSSASSSSSPSSSSSVSSAVGGTPPLHSDAMYFINQGTSSLHRNIA